MCVPPAAASFTLNHIYDILLLALFLLSFVFSWSVQFGFGFYCVCVCVLLCSSVCEFLWMGSRHMNAPQRQAKLIASGILIQDLRIEYTRRSARSLVLFAWNCIGESIGLLAWCESEFNSFLFPFHLMHTFNSMKVASTQRSQLNIDKCFWTLLPLRLRRFAAKLFQVRQRSSNFSNTFFFFFPDFVCWCCFCPSPSFSAVCGCEYTSMHSSNQCVHWIR